MGIDLLKYKKGRTHRLAGEDAALLYEDGCTIIEASVATVL